ncbi:MAG: zinc ribbon domain-containing protein [archaeon]|nr:MAG: zinc ribbon domain-containing protein [archaeon]
MFKKKKQCPKCGKKVEENHKFCPFCGSLIKKGEKYQDPFKEMEKAMKLPFFLKAPVKGMMKQLNKQMTEANVKTDSIQGQPRIITKGFAINISSKEGKPVVRIKPMGPQHPVPPKKEQPLLIEPKPRKFKEFNKKDAEKFLKLKKKEPKTSVRRLADTVVYELDLPDVTKEKIIINHLGNSIEIKALGKEKAYQKVLPISLKIKKWKLEKKKLILELEP